jgi:hypothetical protein
MRPTRRGDAGEAFSAAEAAEKRGDYNQNRNNRNPDQDRPENGDHGDRGNGGDRQNEKRDAERSESRDKDALPSARLVKPAGAPRRPVPTGSAPAAVRRNDLRLYAGPFRREIPVVHHGVIASGFAAGSYVGCAGAFTSGPRALARVCPLVMIVQEFGQLLAQAFILLAFMAEHHRALEQRVLQLLRQMAPEIGGRCSEHTEVTGGVFVFVDVLRWRRPEIPLSGSRNSISGRFGLAIL